MKEKYAFMKQSENHDDIYEVISHEKYSIVLREHIFDDYINCYYSIEYKV